MQILDPFLSHEDVGLGLLDVGHQSRRRASQQGFAKLQLWVYEPQTKAFVSKSPDLWGHAYYNQWYFFGLGPFDFSNDIFPDLIDYSTDE